MEVEEGSEVDEKSEHASDKAEDASDNETSASEQEESTEEEDETEPDAGNLFNSIQQSYQKTTVELQNADGMDNVLREYIRLFDAAKAWLLHGNDMEDKVQELEEELENIKMKYDECKEFALNERKEYLSVKKDLQETRRMADLAHTREQNSMEVITGLRAELARISKELGYKTQASAPTDHGPMDSLAVRGREQEGREQERLASELGVVRERLERAVSHSRMMEKWRADREREIDDLTQQLESQETETNKEMRLKERAEAELTKTRADLDQKDQDLAVLTDQFDKVSREYKVLVESNREIKNTYERTQREYEALVLRNSRLQQEVSAHEKSARSIRTELEQRKVVIKSLEREVMHQKREVDMVQRQRDAASRRAELAQAAHADALKQVDRMRVNVVNSLERELKKAHELTHDDALEMERLTREKLMTTKTLARCQEAAAEQTQRLRLEEHARRALADELDIHTVAERKQTKQIVAMEVERDRLLAHNTEMEVKVEEALEDARLKQMQVYEGNRRIEEGEARYRQQQNLYEAVRADRNTFAKHLLEAQDTIAELKQKLKVQGHNVEQMKEDITVKESELRRAMKKVEKTEKEREVLRVELQRARDDLSTARADIAAAAAEERRLLTVIATAEADQRQLLLEMEQMVNERDILGSQLVRRNDELALLYVKIHLMDTTMDRGKSQYNQRLDDIRLLKIEVRRLRNEKQLLQRSLDNMANLRKEVFHLERDLTRERHKTRALEEELQCPLNVHRWRKLRGTDPTAFDLIEKVQLLQRRLLAQAADAIGREAQLQQAHRLYANLRQLLQRQPGPETAIALQRTQLALRERGRKMKVLAAEANMYEAEMAEFKSAMQRAQSEADELKRKNLEQKRRERKLKEAVKTAAAAAAGGGDVNAGAVVVCDPRANPPLPVRRFLGAGYNVGLKPVT